MTNDLTSAIRPALVLTLLFALLTGIAYPAVITGVVQLAFPHQANGSLIRDGSGRVIGSELIGQGFAAPGYFHGRPSAAGKGYDATASSGSNLGPGSKALEDRVLTDRAALGTTDKTPADLLTASGSGLDPHISPEAALFQVARVAAARKLPTDAVQRLVAGQTEQPLLGVLGEPRVNVLALNRALDRMAAAGAQPPR